jgi:hypothetical protein
MGRRSRASRAATVLVAVWFLLIGASAAGAAAREELLQIPPDSVAPGSEAGELNNPRDATAAPTTGHIYISERPNARISEFTAWGAFVKAWGWDVAPGAVDEEQEVRVRGSEGQFKLSFEGDTTTDLSFDAGATEVEAALHALPAIATGGGGVTVSGGTGATGAEVRVYVVRFDTGPLAGNDVAQLVASNGTVPLAGVPLPGASVRTRANGTPGGVELESCTTASGCQAGDAGNGPGQFNLPKGIAIDANGDLYVFENPLGAETLRLQKFNSEGKLLWMIGGGVNQGGGVPANPGNICTAAHIANGDTCGAGTPGTGPREFSTTSLRNFIVYSSTANALLVGDKDRIQEINPDGSFKGQIAFEGALEEFDEKTVSALEVDSAGNIYLAFSATEDVFKLSAAGVKVGSPYPVKDPVALTVDAEDILYVVEGDTEPEDPVGAPDEVIGFAVSADCITGMCPGDGFARPPGAIALNDLGDNLCAGSESPGNLYAVAFQSGSASYLKGYGTPPIGCEPPPPAPPEVIDQFAVSADTDGALVQAQINPRFWQDTTYFVQYGTKPCSEGGCTKEQPAPPGLLLTANSINAPLRTAGVFLGGLSPNTTYFYRFVAVSTGGGPTVGAEASFTTFAEEDGPPPCPANEAFRIGPSAKLPDCRAYEMVSPLEKGNGDVQVRDINNQHQSSISGERFTYSSPTPFDGSDAGPMISQYLAERHPPGDPQEGWTSEPLSPARTRALDVGPLERLKNEFKLFSADLCQAWLRPTFDPPLTEDAIQGHFNLYRRENCGAAKGTYEALTTVEPEEVPPLEYNGLELQGLSADTTRTVYAANDSLTDDAPKAAKCPSGFGCYYQLYERDADGQLRFVCILPDGKAVDPSKEACYLGTARDSLGQGTGGSFENAVSADGRRIFWTAGVVEIGGEGLGGGQIYVRIDEDLNTPGDEKTIAVSKAAETLSGTNKSIYWTASENGTRAIFTTGALGSGADLYEFAVDTETTTLIAPDVLGLVGTSEDASRLYFVSTAALPGSGTNGEGKEAVGGGLNLYLRDEAGTSFIGTLAAADKGGLGFLSPFAEMPLGRLARTTPDGKHLAFTSTAPLTGFDNKDAITGTPAAEVFHYDADTDQLHCVSCNPTGIRPTAREEGGIWTAAQIPGYERALYASRLLSEDGRRLFFESFEALLPRDTNGQQDVYQWEEAGKGSCDSADSSFNPKAGGCVELISSGESPRESSFLDASPSGNDVFFATLSSLVPPDYGLVDIYDARVEGGFAYPEPVPPCEGEACQSPPPPPPAVTPASSAYVGPGNPKIQKKCPKGKRKAKKKGGKVRCVKKKKQGKKQGKRGSGAKGRAGR